MDTETRNAVRRAISGQDEEPVTLQTDPGGEGVTESSQEPSSHPHEPQGEEPGVDGAAVLAKLQQLYPGHFNHAVAEVKIDMLMQLLQGRQ